MILCAMCHYSFVLGLSYCCVLHVCRQQVPREVLRGLQRERGNAVACALPVQHILNFNTPIGYAETKLTQF